MTYEDFKFPPIILILSDPYEFLICHLQHFLTILQNIIFVLQDLDCSKHFDNHKSKLQQNE
jgi:hypothetical protein